MRQIIADIHCHATMKPYGQSFPARTQANDLDDETSLYYYKPQTFWDKVLNKFTGLTEFRQADFTALKYGGINIVFCALYPLEKGFCRTNFGTGDLIDDGLNLVTGVGKNRINFIQDLSNGYFDDLQKEYDFLVSLDGQETDIDGKKVVYKLISKFSDIESYEKQYGDDYYVINVVVTFEGTHSLYYDFSSIGDTDDITKKQLLDNLHTIKQWKFCPPFVTFAHHFYNGFCGHAASLTDGVIKVFTNQKFHLNDPMTDLGKQMIRAWLDNKNGKRILIDIKHMSQASRQDYFAILDAEYKDENIPIIISHGAVRGNDTNSNLFYDFDINFSDDEIIRVGKSEGLFGVQNYLKISLIDIR